MNQVILNKTIVDLMGESPNKENLIILQRRLKSVRGRFFDLLKCPYDSLSPKQFIASTAVIEFLKNKDFDKAFFELKQCVGTEKYVSVEEFRLLEDMIAMFIFAMP